MRIVFIDIFVLINCFETARLSGVTLCSFSGIVTPTAKSKVLLLDLEAKRAWYKINLSNSERVLVQNQFQWLRALQR